MEDENRNERVLAVVEALADAFADWLPEDATQGDVIHIVTAFALERCACAADSAERAVELVAETARILAKVATERAHEVHAIFADVVAAAEDSGALPEGEDQ